MKPSITEKDVDALLPFYVNGTLDGAEQAAAADAVANVADVDTQVKALAAIRQTVKTIDDQIQSPGEVGLKRLMADIDQINGAVPIMAKAANTNAAPLWQRFGGYAVAACLGAFAVFVAAPTADLSDFAVPATGEVILDGPDMTMTVSFSQDAKFADITEVLRAEDLVIVDGPSARGLFVLANLDGGVLTFAQAEKLRDLSALFATVDNPL